MSWGAAVRADDPATALSGWGRRAPGCTSTRSAARLAPYAVVKKVSEGAGACACLGEFDRSGYRRIERHPKPLVRTKLQSGLSALSARHPAEGEISSMGFQANAGRPYTDVVGTGDPIGGGMYDWETMA